MLLRLAWRNLWRNSRRTGLTAAAGVFASLLTIFQLGLAHGSHERWVDQVVRLYPGHVEVSLIGYRDNRTLDYGMTLRAGEASGFDALPGLEGWTPRLESWALAIPDRDDATGRAAWLVGLSPEREQGLSGLSKGVREGRFLEDDGAYEVVLGATLAKNLGVEVGDQIILLAGDYYGSQSADRFRVAGLLSVGDTRFDGYAAIARIEVLQEFLVFPGGVSHVAFFAHESEAADGIRERLSATFSPGHYEILTWPELVPDIMQFMLLDDIGNWLTLAILITVVAFGLLNTILMSVFERVREFGVMRAMGVRPRAVFSLVLIESLLISAIGIAIGSAIGIPLMLYLAQHPIVLSDPSGVMELFSLEPIIVFKLLPSHVAWTVGVLMGVALLAALPPGLRAGRGRPVDALREA